MCAGLRILRSLLTSFFFSAPAKPEKPTVEGTGADKVKVTYNFGLGGGYTHEFLVMYRRKCKNSILKGCSILFSLWCNLSNEFSWCHLFISNCKMKFGTCFFLLPFLGLKRSHLTDSVCSHLKSIFPCVIINSPY